MENAGRAVARAAMSLAGGTYGRRTVVISGRGNNGGDGLVAARLLDRWGLGVSVVMMTGPEELRGAAAESFRRFTRVGGRWLRFAPHVQREDLMGLVPHRVPGTHKRSSGVVMVLAGSRAMTGAAALTASAAYRAGAGLVVLAVPEGILAVVESAISEATFLPLPETE